MILSSDLITLAFNSFILQQLQHFSLSTGQLWAKPTRISGLLTYHCNLRCRQCDIWKMPSSPQLELSTIEWQDILLQLADWLGPYVIVLSGGEPFIRQDLLDLLHFAHEHRIRVGLVTNGTLINTAVVREVMTAQPFNINISLDGVGDTHNDLRGGSNIYARAIQAIANLQKERDRIGANTALIIKTTIMQQNLNELGQLVWLTQKMKLTGIIFQPIGQNPGADDDLHWYQHSPFVPDDSEQTSRVFNELIALKRAGLPILNSFSHLQQIKTFFLNPHNNPTNNCPVGVRNLNILPDGTISLCHYQAHDIGNVKEDSIKDIWRSPRAAAARRKIAVCQRACLWPCLKSNTLRENISLFMGLLKNQ